MSRQIFSNGAVSRLSRTLAPGALKVYVQDAGMFPRPIPGEEFFYASLAGTCDQKVEIVRVVQNCGDCLVLDRRGEQGTQAQAFVADDMCYHSLTATSVQAIMDSWSWYLGAFPKPPVTDNSGNPLEAGALYYDTSSQATFIWDGTMWIPVTHPMPSLAGAFTYKITQDEAPGFVFPLLDIYGNQMLDLKSDTHLVELFLNGVRQPEEINNTLLLGAFTVDYILDKITFIQEIDGDPGVALKVDDLVEIIIHHKLDVGDAPSLYGAYDNGYNDGFY